MKKSSLLRRLMEAPDILMMPVAHDGLSARIIQAAGFKAVFAAGYGASASLLGAPDISLLTLTEMADYVSRICQATDLPVLADGDTGHGGLLNAARTVRLFEGAGAAGMFVEDQIFPKRCGHMAGKEVVPAPEMLARLAAVLDARADPDFIVMARTDALAVHGEDEAVRRANLYLEAGADIVFVEAPPDEAAMRRITARAPGPHLANMIPGGKTPLFTAAELQDMGFAVAAYPTVGVYAAAKAMARAFDSLAMHGDVSRLAGDMLDFAAFNRLLGLDGLREKERAWAEKAGAAGRKRTGDA